MKKIRILSIILLWITIWGATFLQGCRRETDSWPYVYNDREVYNLKGKVKSIAKKAYGVSLNETGEKTDSLFGHEQKYFNADGLMVKEILYRDEHTELGYSIYRYDGKMNEIIEEQYNLSNRKEGKIISKIDNKGQTTAITAFNRKGNFDYRRIFIYDSTNNFSGDVVEIKNYSKTPDHLITTEKYIYDKHGNKMEETLLDKEGIRHHYFYGYDAAGHLTQLIRHGYNDKLIDTLTYQYHFDATGNWIERKIYNNGKLNAVVKREIEYY